MIRKPRSARPPDRVDDTRLVGVAHRHEDGTGSGQERSRCRSGSWRRRSGSLCRCPSPRRSSASPGPSTVSTPGKRAKGKTASFTAMWLLPGRLQAETRERRADHQLRGDLGDRHADRLGDEGHGARGARIDLEHVDVAVLDARYCTFISPTTPSAVASAIVWRSISAIVSRGSECGGSEQAESPEWMPASSMCSITPQTKTSRAVAERIDVHLDRVRKIAVEEQRVLAEHRVDLPGLVVRIARPHIGRHQLGQRAEQVGVQRVLVADDLHGAAAEHVGGPHDQRQAELGRRRGAPARPNRRCRSSPGAARAASGTLRSGRGPRRGRWRRARCRGSARSPPAARRRASAASARRTAR